MLLYYITDRRRFPGNDTEQRSALFAKIAEAAQAGVDYIQLREKDLPARALEQLAREAIKIVRLQNTRTKLLINSRSDVALAVGADGVHLTSNDIAASEVRSLWRARDSQQPLIAVSCHSAAEVQLAASHGADFAVLAPIFEKVETGATGIGLKALRAATGLNRRKKKAVEGGDRHASMPVLALGGVTLENTQACLTAGAAGIAAIRLFQQSAIQLTVNGLEKQRA